MGTPYKMKGSPMARNYGAPFKQGGDKSPPTYNQQDSSWAIGIRSGEDLTSANSSSNYKPSVSEVDKGSYTNAKKILKETDAKVKASGNHGVVKQDSKRILKEDYRNNQKKKRTKNLMNKAVKGTEKNTYGVLASQKNK